MTKSKAGINTPEIMVLVIWCVDGPGLVQIVPPNSDVRSKHLCELAISHLEINVKMHPPKEGLKGIMFH
jgi:hypothetical protein